MSHRTSPPVMPTLLGIFALAIAAPRTSAQDPDPKPVAQISVRVPLDGTTPRELQLYPIRDIVDGILDAQDGIGNSAPGAATETARAMLRTLRDGISTFVEPAFEDGEEVQALGHDHLAVVGRPEQHAWVRRFLELQRSTANTIASTEIEILMLTPERFAKLGIGSEPRVLQGDELAKFRRSLLGADGTPVDESLAAPVISALAMQRAKVSAIEQTAYVKDFNVQVIGSAEVIIDPVVDVIESGISLEGAFHVLAPNVFGVAWHLHLADLQKPIPKFETTLGTGQPVSIQLPNVATADFDAKLVLPAGATAVLPAPELRGKRIVVLMSMRGLDDAPGDRRESAATDTAAGTTSETPATRRR